MEKEKKLIYKKWWFWVIIIFIIGAIGSITETNNTIEASSNIQSEVKQESEEEKQQRLEQERIAKEKEEAERDARKKEEEQKFKAEAENLTYEQLARNPEKVKGKKVKLTGQVIQTLQGGTSVDLRINITKDSYGHYSDTIYALYIPKEGEDKILEDDIITFWGTACGDYSYTSVLGSTITLPFINISYLEIN